MKKSYTNVIIFAIVTAGCGFAGVFLNNLTSAENQMEGLGALVWLVSPLLANILLCWLGGDGWKDFGINPNLKRGWKWYFIALLIVSAVLLTLLGLSVLSGAVKTPGFNSSGFSTLTAAIGTYFVGSSIKNIFEEFSWRGYLTPKLDALKLHPVKNSLITGLIWASWHIPYYLFFLNLSDIESQTSLNQTGLIILALVMLPFQAFAYGELRLISKSVWPGWLLHTFTNAVSFGLMSGFVVLSKDLRSVILTPGADGIGYGLLMGLIGWGLYRYRSRTSNQQPCLKEKSIEEIS